MRKVGVRCGGGAALEGILLHAFTLRHRCTIHELSGPKISYPAIIPSAERWGNLLAVDHSMMPCTTVLPFRSYKPLHIM